MHSEYFRLEHDTAARLNLAKKQGKRIIAVGTTTTRVLETCAMTANNKLKEKYGTTDIFIYPPYKFKFVDTLITNFHLPHSTLLALVSAFVSEPNTEHKFTDFKESIVGKAYLTAIKKHYRFYSFGDGMMIG
jgi:S-adenosylmethionine:tRNA ribosyltransferase-isomerase